MNDEKRVNEITQKNVIKELVPYFIILISVLLIRTFIATPVRVDGSSMNPTLKSNEIMILNLTNDDYDRNDIVVVGPIDLPDGSRGDVIKRVVGLPGEEISCVNGVIYIDDEKYNDEYANGNTDCGTYDNVKLEDNEYFILGDNRGVSYDSRLMGPIKYDDIQGTTNLVIFPFSKIGKVD